jgi:hypothetical protein
MQVRVRALSKQRSAITVTTKILLLEHAILAPQTVCGIRWKSQPVNAAHQVVHRTQNPAAVLLGHLLAPTTTNFSTKPEFVSPVLPIAFWTKILVSALLGLATSTLSPAKVLWLLVFARDRAALRLQAVTEQAIQAIAKPLLPYLLTT